MNNLSPKAHDRNIHINERNDGNQLGQKSGNTITVTGLIIDIPRVELDLLDYIVAIEVHIKKQNGEIKVLYLKDVINRFLSRSQFRIGAKVKITISPNLPHNFLIDYLGFSPQAYLNTKFSNNLNNSNFSINNINNINNNSNNINNKSNVNIYSKKDSKFIILNKGKEIQDSEDASEWIHKIIPSIPFLNKVRDILELNLNVETSSEFVLKSKSKSNAQTKANSKSDSNSESESESNSDTKSNSKSKSNMQSISKSKSKSKSNSKLKVEQEPSLNSDIPFNSTTNNMNIDLNNNQSIKRKSRKSLYDKNLLIKIEKEIFYLVGICKEFIVYDTFEIPFLEFFLYDIESSDKIKVCVKNYQLNFNNILLDQQDQQIVLIPKATLRISKFLNLYLCVNFNENKIYPIGNIPSSRIQFLNNCFEFPLREPILFPSNIMIRSKFQMNFYIKQISFFDISLVCAKCQNLLETSKSKEKNCKCEESECKLMIKIIGEGNKSFKFKALQNQAIRLLNLNEKHIQELILHIKLYGPVKCNLKYCSFPFHNKINKIISNFGKYKIFSGIFSPLCKVASIENNDFIFVNGFLEYNQENNPVNEQSFLGRQGLYLIVHDAWEPKNYSFQP